MRINRTMEDKQAIQQDESLENDPFVLLASMEGPVSMITSTVSRSLPYGEVKCSTTVSMTCPQITACINQAASMTFKKARELTNKGFKELVPDATDL